MLTITPSTTSDHQPSIFCSSTFFMVSGAKKPGLPSKAEARGWPTAGVFVLGRFKGKQVPLGSKLLLTSAGPSSTGFIRVCLKLGHTN